MLTCTIAIEERRTPGVRKDGVAPRARQAVPAPVWMPWPGLGIPGYSRRQRTEEQHHSPEDAAPGDRPGPDAGTGSEANRQEGTAERGPVRVLIADDHGLLRVGLSALLHPEPGIEIVGEAADGYETLVLADRLRPDVILADITMPGPSGIDIARELKAQLPKIRVLIVTMHEDRQLVEDAIRAGAAGFLVKRAAERELVRAIETVAKGDVYIQEDLREPPKHEGILAQTALPAVELSPDEMNVLRNIAQGKPNFRIARDLNMDARLVEEIRVTLMQKLNVRSRVGLIAYARRLGL